MTEAAVTVGAIAATGCGAKDADGDVFTSAGGSKEREALSILFVEVAVLAIEDAIAACCRVRYGAVLVLLLSWCALEFMRRRLCADGIMQGVLAVIFIVWNDVEGGILMTCVVTISLELAV